MILIILFVSVVLGQRCAELCSTEIQLIDQPDPPEKLPNDFDCPQVRDLSRFEPVRRHVSSPDLLVFQSQSHDLNLAQQQRSPVLCNSFQHPAPEPANFMNTTAMPLEQKQAHDFGQSLAAASFVQDGTSHPPHACGSLPFADFHMRSKHSSFFLSPAEIGTNAAPGSGFLENCGTCNLPSPPKGFLPKADLRSIWAQPYLLPPNGLECLAAGRYGRTCWFCCFCPILKNNCHLKMHPAFLY